MNLGKYVSCCLILLILSSLSFAQEETMKKEKMMNEDEMMMQISQNSSGVAIDGYDPVAYFIDGKAEKGIMEYSYKWGGATWYFSGKDHMMMFVKNPKMYVPQYGGHCAFGASAGHLADADPEAWVIKDGKLYLNSDPDVCKSFEMDIENKIMKADKNWKNGKL